MSLFSLKAPCSSQHRKIVCWLFYLGTKYTAEGPCIRKPFWFADTWLSLSLFLCHCLSVYLCFSVSVFLPLSLYIYLSHLLKGCLWTQEPAALASEVLGLQLHLMIIFLCLIVDETQSWSLHTLSKFATIDLYPQLFEFWISKFWLGHEISRTK